MKVTFSVLLLILGLLSLAVWRTQPPAEPRGKVVLVRLSDQNPQREAQVALFNKLYPGIDLELDPSSLDPDKVIVQCIGGVGPDVFDCFDAYQLSAFVQSGIALDITDELKNRGIDLNKECFPGILKSAIYEGRVYGIPTNIATDGLWYHKDIFANNGIKPHKGPWRWSEFIPIAQKLTQRDAQGRPLRYGFLFSWWDWPFFFAGYNAHVYSPDGTRCTVDSKEGIAAVQMMHDLVYKYRVSSNPVEEASMASAGGYGSGDITVFGAKRAAMALGGRYWLGTLRDYKDIDIGVMEPPFGTARQFHAYGRTVIINKASKHQAEDLDCLLYQTGPEYNNLVDDQADCISAFKKYTITKQFLFNPQFPNETDNAVWREITLRGIPDDTSPYANGRVVQRVMTEQLDLVKADEKTPAQAMHDAAQQINEEIAKTRWQGRS